MNGQQVVVLLRFILQVTWIIGSGITVMLFRGVLGFFGITHSVLSNISRKM